MRANRTELHNASFSGQMDVVEHLLENKVGVDVHDKNGRTPLFIASEEGLGYLMQQVQVTLDTAAMFMAVLVITLIGVILYGAVLLLEHLTVPRDGRVAAG